MDSLKERKLPGRKAILIGFYLLMSLIFGFIICYVCFTRTQGRLVTTRSYVDSERNKMQYAIDSRLMYTEILEIDVVNHNGEVFDFEEVAAHLCQSDPAVRALELAPQGVIELIYPEQGNQSAHLNLFESPRESADAYLARDTGQTILSGPFELTQGGMGMVARNPIYLENAQGQEEFWGFSIVVFNMPELFESADWNLPSNKGYDYRLWRALPDTGEVQVISENTDKPLGNAIREEFHILNATWYLDIAPKDKWVPRSTLFWQIVIFAVITLLSMIAISAHLTVREQREALLQQKAELIKQNNTDGLTGLLNRRCFMDRLRAIFMAKKPCAVYYLDLNDFKEVNDSYGHDEGDHLLLEVAKRLSSCIREEDLAARIGGDEFTVVVTTGETEEYCTELQNRIIASIAEPYITDKVTLHPSISVGFARCPADSVDMEHLLSLADQRMYTQKREHKAEFREDRE